MQDNATHPAISAQAPSTEAQQKAAEVFLLDWTLSFSKKMSKDERLKFYERFKEEAVGYLKRKKAANVSLKFNFYEVPNNTGLIRIRVDWISTGSIHPLPGPPPPPIHPADLKFLSDNKPDLFVDNSAFKQGVTSSVGL